MMAPTSPIWFTTPWRNAFSVEVFVSAAEFANCASSFAAIAAAFGDRALVLPEVDAGNRIVLALNGPTLDVPFAVLDDEAGRIQAHLGLPARRWVAELRVENGFDHNLRV